MPGTKKFLIALGYRVVLLALVILFAYRYYSIFEGDGRLISSLFALVAGLLVGVLSASIFIAWFGIPRAGLMTAWGINLYDEYGFFKAEEMILCETISLCFQAMLTAVFLFFLFISGIVSLFILLPSSLLKLKLMPQELQKIGKALNPSLTFSWVGILNKSIS